MNHSSSIDVLNRLLAVLSRSLPMYLTYARPWTHRGAEEAVETFEQIVTDQRTLAQRISRAVIDAGGIPDLGEFPMDFTDLHDLTIDYLVRTAIVQQQQDIAEIEDCVDKLRLAPAAKPLAEEALGLAKGHLESLQELVNQPA